jgi:tRNA pseudouridine55 synthase
MNRQSGFLNIYKLSGPTSYDCIRALKRIFRRENAPPPKLGHLGTLDPLAEGVLPVALGAARKLISLFKADKTYWASIRLGLTTDTDDIQGLAIRNADVSQLDEATISTALTEFVGDIEQVPPKFSAVSTQGRKAYKRAREGEEFNLKPRRVRVVSIEMLAWNTPDLELRMAVGPGTYIRSFARDIGERLSVGGCVATLKREADGPFLVDNTVTIDELEQGGVDGILRNLLPPDYILGAYRRVDLSVDEGAAFSLGKQVSGIEFPTEGGTGYIRVYDPDGFIGMGVMSQQGALKPYKVIRKVDR